VTQAIAALAAEHGRLAVDTEFMSERRYRALLCLVQVAVPDPEAEEGVRTDVLDPLEDGSFDPAPLAAALADPKIEVVMHAGRQDVALLRRDWHTEVHGLFDTQVGAGFLGLGPQEGYESLVRRVLGLKLKGGEGFTRWDRRPLTDAQLSYARADASRLLALGETLQGRLEARGRLEWALEECRPLERSTDNRDPVRLFERLPKIGRLSAEGRGVARELIDWRESAAERADRAASSILPDQALTEVARRMPQSRQALEEIRGLPQPTLHRRHRELLEAIERGRSREVPAPAGGAPPRDARDAPVVALAQAVVRHRAQEAEVATELVATQAEVSELVSALRGGDTPRARVAAGWRHELVGRELEELLAGRRSVSVADGSRLELDEV
jgi:ribonuclease D